MDDHHAGYARRIEHRPAWPDRAPSTIRHCERFPKAARLKEVALHIDDDECCARQIERQTASVQP